MKPTTEPGRVAGSSTSLYALTEDYVRLVERIAEADGVLDDDMDAALEAFEGTLPQKVDSIAAAIGELQAHEQTLKAEAKRLTDRARVTANTVSGLKEYVRRNLERLGKQSVDCARFKISRRLSPPAVEILDAGLIPDDFATVTWSMPRDTSRRVLELVTKHAEQEIADALVGTIGGADVKIDKRAIVARWKDCGGIEDVPGTRVTQGETLQIR